MGVHGLWKLVEPSGKIVPLDTLENKVLAVDVSIWLHQALKGFQDARGNAVPNAHLLGLFHRICKLLFYKIKPVFVFDGGIPHLKKQTVAARRQQKSKAEQKSEQTREMLLKNIIKHRALRKVLGLGQNAPEVDVRSACSQQAADMFQLPPMQEHLLSEGSENEQHDDNTDDDALEEVLHGQHFKDLHSINVNSAEFKALPANVRHDILSELKETRKQSSWGRLHEIPKDQEKTINKMLMKSTSLCRRRACLKFITKSIVGVNEWSTSKKPFTPQWLFITFMLKYLSKKILFFQDMELNPEVESGDFSSYQMERLLKRRSVQVSLEEAEKEMGGRTLSLGELEALLCDQGVVLTPDLGRRIASDNVTKYLFIKESQDAECKKSSVVDSSSELSEFGSSPEKAKSVLPPETKTTECTKVNITECTEIKELDSCVPSSTENIILESGIISSDEDQDNMVVTTHDPLLQVARDFMLENSSLTQQQILSVIKSQNISDDSTNPAPETSSPTSKSEMVIDKEKVDSENLGVTQKEILALIQDELERCKAVLEADSERQFGKDTSTTAENGLLNTGETETLNCTSSSLSADTGTSENVNASQQSENTTKVCLSQDKQISSCIAEGESDVPLEEKNTSNEESDGDFVEVEQDFSVGVESQRVVHKANNADGPMITRNEVTEDDDIFADVFLSTDTKKLDEILGKLSKSQQVTSKEGVGRSCVFNDVTGKEDTLGSVFSQESTKTVLHYNSVEKMSDSDSNYLLKEDCESKQNEDLYCIEDEDKIGTGSEDKNSKENVASVPKPVEKISLQELRTLEVNLEKEQTSLLAEKGKQERLAASITDQMYLEAQELLRLFGIPYVVAPMEAEAQCAFLDVMSLTDGTITDDSDIWLFGGQKVYKNFFNHKKQVLQFQAIDILHYFKLNRQQLILLALLVGSDYTIGLQGVGPVTALEILGVFPPSKQLDQDSHSLLHGLKLFRDWLRSGAGVGPGKAALRSKLKNICVHEGFPSLSVVEAYLHPQVDESKEAFSWGTPDLLALQNFARKKFSWTSKKTDEILLPVLKRLNESKSQMSIDSYFKVETVLQAADGKMSKRVQQAIRKIGGESSYDSEEPKPKKPRKANKCKIQLEKQNTQNVGGDCDITHDNVAGERNVIQDTNLPGTSGINVSPSKEFIPQREQDKINSLKTKMRAIEVFRKSKFGLDRTKRDRRVKRQILKEAYLSESSSDSS